MSMNIQFKCNKIQYQLTSDSRQFILNISNGKGKDGKEVWHNSVFFPDLPRMLLHLYDVGLRGNNVDNFRDLVKHSEKIKDEVVKISNLFTKE